jgi:hypothetical protein
MFACSAPLPWEANGGEFANFIVSPDDVSEVCGLNSVRDHSVRMVETIKMMMMLIIIII